MEPLDRKYLWAATKPARVLLALFFLGFSWYSTEVEGSTFLLAHMEMPIRTAQIVAGVAALLFTAAQWLTNGTWWYIIPFAPDVYFTYRFTFPFVYDFFDGNVRFVYLGTLLWAMSVAYFGEVLLWGRRKPGFSRAKGKAGKPQTPQPKSS